MTVLEPENVALQILSARYPRLYARAEDIESRATNVTACGLTAICDLPRDACAIEWRRLSRGSIHQRLTGDFHHAVGT
jgi:hypothetical protein